MARCEEWCLTVYRNSASPLTELQCLITCCLSNRFVSLHRLAQPTPYSFTYQPNRSMREQLRVCWRSRTGVHMQTAQLPAIPSGRSAPFDTCNPLHLSAIFAQATSLTRRIINSAAWKLVQSNLRRRRVHKSVVICHDSMYTIYFHTLFLL